MKTQTTLAALGLLLTALALPSVHAGSLANPEIVDSNDEVAVSGACSGGPSATPPCPGFDFLWSQVDINSGYVSDTVSDVLLTLEMKAATSFQPGLTPGFGPATVPGSPTMSYDYVYTATSGATTVTASAHLAPDGTITPGGAATTAVVHDGNQLTFTVPKSALGITGAGSLVTGLFVTAHGQDAGDGDFTLDDRAPDANFGRDYLTLNGTGLAPKTTYATLTGATPSIQEGFAVNTTAIHVYNWTSPAADLTIGYNVHVVAGSLAIRIATAANQTVQQGTFTASDKGNATLHGASGPLVITLTYTGFNGTAAFTFAATPAPTATTSSSTTTSASSTTTQSPFTFTPSTSASSSTTAARTTSSSTSKGSPAIGLVSVLLAAGIALVLVRRRLQ